MDKNTLLELKVTQQENAGGTVTYTVTADDGDGDAWVEDITVFSNDVDLPESARNWIAAACKKMTLSTLESL